MIPFFKRIFFYGKFGSKDKRLRHSIRSITGMRPINTELYHIATQHRSIAKENEKGFRESNERLEYLGDAILGAIIAEYLFKKYPYRDEGFLTEIRSRIVNRDTLNEVSRKMGVGEIVEYSGNGSSRMAYKSLYGDTLEALIGAIYLDHGYSMTKKFIQKKLLRRYYDLDQILQTNLNYKSKIIEWAHRNGKEVHFEVSETTVKGKNRQFIAHVIIDGKPVSKGAGYSKKKAEQDAAKKSCEKLGIE